MRRDWGEELFSFEGRVSRARYWLVPLVPFALLVVFTFVVDWVLDTFVGRGAGPALALIVIGVPLFLLYLAVTASHTVRRLHDRGRSGHLAWLFIGVPWLTGVLALLLGSINAQSTPALLLLGVLVISTVGLAIWAIVECGCLRGTAGPNDFGPEPLPAGARGLDDEHVPQRPSRPPRPSAPPRSKVRDMPVTMKGLGHTLFGFGGRLNRAPYIVWSLVIAVISAGAFFAIATPLGWLEAAVPDMRPRLLLAGISAVLLWPTLALLVKRLNDRDRPAWLAALVLVPSYVNIFVTPHVGQFKFDSNTDTPLQVALGLLVVIVSVYAFIELWCLRGTVGENRHGPDPVEGKDQRRPAAVREA